MRTEISSRSFGRHEPGRPTVVVLPGLGVSRYLRPACAHLADSWQRRVLLVDPPGFGASAGAVTGRVTVASVARRLARWLEEQGPVVLVGQSTGCLLATALAARFGDDSGRSVLGVCLVGPVFDPRGSTVPRATLGLLRDGAAEPWWLGPSEAPEWVTNARPLPAYLRSCLRVDLDKELGRVACEVVVVRGDRDPLSRHEWAARLADGPRRTLVTVPGGAHTFMAARPELLARSLDVGGLGPGAGEAR